MFTVLPRVALLTVLKLGNSDVFSGTDPMTTLGYVSTLSLERVSLSISTLPRLMETRSLFCQSEHRLLIRPYLALSYGS